jgi:hypothetical protein
VKLCCPVCGTWTVPFSGETWGPSEHSDFASGPVEVLAGKCERCGSVVVFAASAQAVETAAARVTAARQAIAKVAGGA